MSIAKVIEISSSSKTSIEDAVRNGLKKVAETVQGIQGAWINETKVETEAAADRGFSGAHRSDEHEVGGGIHGWRC